LLRAQAWQDLSAGIVGIGVFRQWQGANVLGDHARNQNPVQQLSEAEQAESKEPEKPGYWFAGVEAVNDAEPKNAGKPQEVRHAG
jgi:hypothetical protein